MHFYKKSLIVQGLFLFTVLFLECGTGIFFNTGVSEITTSLPANPNKTSELSHSVS